MKRSILTLLVGPLCFMCRAKAQWTIIDPSNLVQNIKSTVQSPTMVINMVKSLQENIEIYSQNKAYYDAPKSVHNIIKDAWKVKLTLEMASEITETYASGFNRMVSDSNFTIGELAAILAGYARLLEEDGALVTELKTIITGNDGLSFSDKGWMDVADQVYTKMLEYRNPTRYYIYKIISISSIHSRGKGDAHRVLVFYENSNGKYW